MTYPIAMLVYSYFVIKNNELWAKIIGILSIVLALSTHWYTGVVMELNPGRFLNHTALAPLLFLTGAFISGIGLLVLILWIRNMIVSRRKADRLDAHRRDGSIHDVRAESFDAFLLFLEFMQSMYGSQAEVMGHEEVLLGVFRFPYLWLEIVIGLIFPFFILVSPLRKTRPGIIIASFMVAIGVYGMRIWWVMGGQYLQTFY